MEFLTRPVGMPNLQEGEIERAQHQCEKQAESDRTQMIGLGLEAGGDVVEHHGWCSDKVPTVQADESP